jgi:DNA helicase-2/ATP-dependent DNA helicase PcrA
LSLNAALNTAQETAAATLSGPLLVLAGAGTGKTRVVTYRIARLVHSGIKANRILAVTFTNKAAREMQERIGALLKQTAAAKLKPEISTFHSLCVRILRRHITKLGYPQTFAIYDRGDQESVARQVLKEIKVQDASLKPAELLAKISTWKSEGISADNVHKNVWSAKDYLASIAYGHYQNALKTVGAVDFDDLLLAAEELFRKFPDVLKSEADRFDHILVDEYQDTNMSQYRIVKGLALPHRNICVVGDDDQAIYAWRGADVKHILSFQKDWTDAKIVRLEENYRSTQPIIHWANTLIAFNKQRHGKRLTAPCDGDSPVILQCRDGETEARTVVTRIKERIEKATVQPRDIAVLFRTNDQPRVFETELRSQKIPYILIGSNSFFDRKEVRDVLAYLKVLNRPQDDVSLLRIINTPPRGIGQTAVQKMTEVSVAANKPIWETLNTPESSNSGGNNNNVSGMLPSMPSAPLNPNLLSFRHLIESQRHILERDFSVDNLKHFIAEIQYEKEITRQYAEESERKERWESVGEVINAAAEYIRESREESRKPVLWEFLGNTSLAGPDFTSGKSETSRKAGNAVTLMTLHSAKGLEFSEVYMVGLEEGILPHHRSIKASDEDEFAVDEERRLCYVGITRAKRRLTVSLALNRFKWGKMCPTIPSRFLYEFTEQTGSPNYWRAIAGEVPQKQSSSPEKTA